MIGLTALPPGSIIERPDPRTPAHGVSGIAAMLAS